MTVQSEHNSNTNPLLREKEWVIFQINEGPCAQGCPFCYERPFTITKLVEAKNNGDISIPEQEALNRMSTKELARVASQYRGKLGFEISIDELEKYFRLLKQAGINRAGLTGSQPSEHSHFSDVLDTAEKVGLKLRVYTADYRIDRLTHPVVQNIILNINHNRNGFDKNYMAKINELIAQEKEIDLRINFESYDLNEKKIIYEFYDNLPMANREKVLLKYSFTVKLAEQPNLAYATPESMKANANKIINFIDEFKNRYHGVNMYTERPVFPCAFTKEQWEKYKDRGGFATKCDSEFTIYSGGLMNFCPPARTVNAYKKIETWEQLRDRILELKRIEKDLKKIPSFSECIKCPLGDDIYCQGGCLGYKVGLV